MSDTSDLLSPVENMALTVARAQVKRGASPMPHVASVLVMALDRIVNEFGNEPLYREATPFEDKMWRESGGTTIDVKRRQVVRIRPPEAIDE